MMVIMFDVLRPVRMNNCHNDEYDQNTYDNHDDNDIFKMICCNILIQASTAAELSDGLAMSEALVQIEPAVFTPSWFAGILKSDNTNYQTLSIILNLLLHFYR